MGACVGSTSTFKKQNTLQSQFQRYHPLEISLLELMFKDICSRSTKPGIIREHFDSFFHLNGLWGEQMFKKFDKNKEGFITFQEFLSSIDIMIKGTFDEKAQVLFDFYNMSKNGGISYDQLIKMIFSYPKEDINKMITQQKFLNSIDEYQKNFYFNPQKLTINQGNIVQQAEEDEKSQQANQKRLYSVVNPKANQFRQMRNQMNGQQKIDLKKKQNFMEKAHKAVMTTNKLEDHQEDVRKIKSITQHTINAKRKNYVVRSNIASLVMRYATFLFNEFKVDIKKGMLTFQQFKSLIKNHQSVFNTYFQGFHGYIWQVGDDNEPNFKKITPWIQSQCVQSYRGDKIRRYLYFIKTTIFVLDKKTSKKAVEIKNLQGLSIEEFKEEDLHGFIIKHRDGIYPEKVFLFEKIQQAKQWIDLLSQFKSNNIYDNFVFLQKTGAGNFSSVYKGIDKQTNEEVAIKVIQKFKLSQNQKSVIKYQCGILQLCHHPNIVKFVKFYNTRSHMYIVSEFLGEGDLFQHVKKNTFLQQYQAAIVFKQLSQAVKYLNELGLIHRDLKPQNIMIQVSKEKNIIQKIKLIDFGFAVYKNNLKSLSQQEKYAGTPGFIAPQAFMGQQFDQSFDVFSMGVILYFMLCGSYPFFSTFYEQIVQQTKQCDIVLKNNHWANVSQQAKDLIYKTVTFKEKRISIKQVIEHPWLKNIQELKKYNKANKKNRYIG